MKEKIFEGHGNHHEPFLGEEEIMPFLSEFVENSMLDMQVKTEYSEEGQPPYETTVYCLKTVPKGEKQEIPYVALIVANKENNRNQLITFYPYLEGIRTTVEILEVLEWSDKVEATIKAVYERNSSQFEFYFFATDYFANKDKYKKGNRIEIGLAASGTVKIASKGFDYEGQAAIDFLRKMGQEPTFDKNGNVEPVHISLEKLVAVFPSSKELPDMVEFQAPVTEIKQEYEAMGKPIRTGEITLNQDTGLKALIYFNSDCNPVEGEGITGVIWLSGHLKA